MKRIRWYAILACTIAWSCNKSETIGEESVWEYDEVTVLEYTPAPGQFINDGFEVSTAAEAASWAQERLAGRLFVSLGAFGGYIVLKPSVSIFTREGYDFGIMGNPITTHNEPGIVWVSRDENGNGMPDDTWYQLKGSDTGRNYYTVTYYRTDQPVDVPWEDSDGQTGSVAYLPSFHVQNYYPMWCDGGGNITFTGTLLQPNFEEVNNQLQNSAYGWGYADNLGSDALYDENGRYLFNRFDLDNAVDSEGQRVLLSSVDFIKVQSALLYNMGSTGELSTEVNALIIYK